MEVSVVWGGRPDDAGWERATVPRLAVKSCERTEILVYTRPARRWTRRKPRMSLATNRCLGSHVSGRRWHVHLAGHLPVWRVDELRQVTRYTAMVRIRARVQATYSCRCGSSV